VQTKMQCSQTASTASLQKLVSNPWTELKERMNPEIDMNLKVH